MTKCSGCGAVFDADLVTGMPMFCAACLSTKLIPQDTPKGVEKRMMRIYVAGKISAPTPLQFMANIKEGMFWSTKLCLLDFAVFNPFLDYHYLLVEPLSLAYLKEASLRWLEVSDAVFICPGWEESGGVKREMIEAEGLKIPIFFSIGELLLYRKGKED